jgi:hypothetical protein
MGEGDTTFEGGRKGINLLENSQVLPSRKISMKVKKRKRLQVVA